MSKVSSLHIGIIILSEEFKIIGMNRYAQKILKVSKKDLGKDIFHYHSEKSQAKIRFLLKRMYENEPDIPITMIIDVLNKVLMLNLSKIELIDQKLGVLYSMNFIDVSHETGASVDPESGKVVINKIPIFCKNKIKFIDKSDIFFIEADGNYSKIHIKNHFFYIHSSLKEILHRFNMKELVRVHKSYAVNLNHVKEIKRLDNVKNIILFDAKDMTPVPISRRNISKVKKLIGLK